MTKTLKLKQNDWIWLFKLLVAFASLISSLVLLRGIDLEYLNKGITFAALYAHWKRVVGFLALVAVVASACVWLIVQWSPRIANFVAASLASTFVFFIYKPLAAMLLRIFPGWTLGIKEAIGHTSYTGYPKTTEYLIFWITVSLSLFLGICLGRFFRNRQKSDLLEFSKAKFKFQLWFVSTLILAFGMAIFPDYSALMEVLKNPAEIGNYDGLNILSWRYFVAKGWLPFRDFWYPYGGTYNETGPFPSDQLRTFGRSMCVFVVFLGSVYSILRFNIVRTLALCAIVGWLTLQGTIFAWNRYFLALDVVLLFFAVREIRSHRTLWVAFAGLFCSWVFMYEPNQLIYSGAALFVVFCASYPRKIEAREIGIFLSALLAGIFVNLGNIYSQGQWPGFVEFYRTAHCMAVFASIPAGIVDWFSLWGRPAHLLVSTNLMLILGCYLAAGKKEDRMAQLLLALAFLTVFGFQKQLVRPHMTEQLIGFQIVGWLLCIFSLSVAFNMKRLIIICAALCIFASKYPLDKATMSRLWKVGSNAAHVASSLRSYLFSALPEEYAPLAFYEKGVRYQKVDFDQIGKMIKVSRAGSSPLFYVLGDESYFYIAFGQKPPRHISLYGGCNVHHQQETIDWIESSGVEYVIWNPLLSEFDEVPNILRLPLLYQHVVKNFSSVGRVGNFLILQRWRDGSRSSAEIDFWMNNLKSSLNLRQIPRVAEPPALKECIGKLGEVCAEYARIETGSLGLGMSSYRFQVSVQGRKFDVSFETNQDFPVYYVNLERLWFWQVFRDLGWDPKIVSLGDAERISVVRGPWDRGRLY